MLSSHAETGCFLQEQYSDALSQLQQLLQQQSNDYTALAQLLTLLRRVGRVQEGQGFLQSAQEHASRAAGMAGDSHESRPLCGLKFWKYVFDLASLLIIYSLSSRSTLVLRSSTQVCLI